MAKPIKNFVASLEIMCAGHHHRSTDQVLDSARRAVYLETNMLRRISLVEDFFRNINDSWYGT